MRQSFMARQLAEREAILRRAGKIEARPEVFSRDDGHLWADCADTVPQWQAYAFFRTLRRLGFKDMDYRLSW